ncbi:hypothetical protein D9756_003401 [Leucocoprinus leucothites]|uniref:Aquaporin-like protein n=1 Tax=Leucocoprinus leucothites TaxID=201217 RepID=A0A8H5G708_9AGAR|nr:hypothetical protein D9756_003401 [Leucoagaricus leucothites]
MWSKLWVLRTSVDERKSIRHRSILLDRPASIRKGVRGKVSKIKSLSHHPVQIREKAQEGNDWLRTATNLAFLQEAPLLSGIMASAVPTVYLRDIQKRSRILDGLELRRNRRQLSWLMELFAEMLGCFMFVYLEIIISRGVGCAINKVEAIVTGQPVLGSSLQAGLAVTFGIAFAVGVCGGTSAGHFNPSFTIAHCVFRGFPKVKALKYLVAQILGGYIACMFVYYQYRFLIERFEDILREGGTLEQTLFTSGGPAGMFAFYLPKGQSLGAAFLNEWVSSVFVGIVYWASIDPSNSIVTPVVSPFFSGLAYGVTIWGFGSAGAALNSARDIGSRLWVITIWGQAASGGRFAAISALTNIPAMLVAAMLYEFLLSDSGRVVTAEALEQIRVTSHHISENTSLVESTGGDRASMNDVKGNVI